MVGPGRLPIVALVYRAGAVRQPGPRPGRWSAEAYRLGESAYLGRGCAGAVFLNALVMACAVSLFDGRESCSNVIFELVLAASPTALGAASERPEILELPVCVLANRGRQS